MNKIVKNIIISLFLFFNLTVVYADDSSLTSCKYDDLGLVVKFDEGGTGHVTQTVYEESHTAPVLNWFWNNSSGKVDIVNQLKHIDKDLYGSCPEKIYACVYEKKGYWNQGLGNLWEDDSGVFYSNLKKVYLFYSENNMKDEEDLANLPNKQWVKSSAIVDNFNVGYEGCDGGVWGAICGGVTAVGLDIWDSATDVKSTYYQAYRSCDYVKYTGDLPTYNLACPNLNIYLGRFNKALNNYKACSKTNAACISQTITEVNEREQVIKDYCKSMLEEYDYVDGTERECLDACMDIANQTIKAKTAAGILSNKTGDCGASGRLLVWLNNIFRWIKYILPVIVIIFGILDFIKAIGSDKEDEMKKAQKKFITRLIAAALVFIIPLIIEFVLTKMGFGYDSCSLF